MPKVHRLDIETEDMFEDILEKLKDKIEELEGRIVVLEIANTYVIG